MQTSQQTVFIATNRGRWPPWLRDVVRSVYFTDPNGIALEASWWVHDPTGRPTDYGDRHFFADPSPTPAVLELQTTGTLCVPSTGHARAHDVTTSNPKPHLAYNSAS